MRSDTTRPIFKHCFTRLLVTTALLIWLPSAHADTVNGSWFVAVDNDTLAQSDDHYTNGLQVGWASGYLNEYAQGPVPSLVASALDRLPLVNAPGRQRFISHSLSHRIFTPTDTEASEPIPGDMPYSGMLFAALTAGAQDGVHMDAFTLQYGLVGPSARGEEVQNEFHRLIGADKINGWDNQIGDEPLLNIGYEHRSRLLTFGQETGWGGDVIGQLGGSAGNLISMATAGIGARFGWGVPDDYGIPPQFFGEETVGSRPYTTYKTNTGIWLVMLLNSSYIANAIFWDGNTFKDSMSVDYDHGIARLYTGIKARSGNWSGTFSVVRTTVPWETPENRDRQTYGRLGVTYTY